MEVYKLAQIVINVSEQQLTKDVGLEQAAFVLSIISLVLSVLVGIGIAIYEVKSSKKLNDISLETSYFNKLYKDYLLIDLPKHRKLITFNYEGKLIGTEDLIAGLKKIREDSLYYFYTDQKFYNQLKKCVQDLEDYILITEDRFVDNMDQVDVHNEITDKIKDIYKVMCSKCFNGKAR